MRQHGIITTSVKNSAGPAKQNSRSLIATDNDREFYFDAG